MKEILTDKKVEEIVLARYEAEGYHKLTPEQEKRSAEIAKEVDEYIRKEREKEKRSTLI